MSTQFLLIDGYNVFFAAGLARAQYGPGQFEACRRRLLQGLADRIGEEHRLRTTIVFDAQQAPEGAPSEEMFAGMRVVFSVGTDADSVIEQMLLEHSAPKQVLVVSSDHRLQRAATRRQAKWIESDRFWERTIGVVEERESASTREEELKTGEVPVDPAEIAKMIKEIRARETAGDGGSGKNESSSSEEGEGETVTGRYERELMERAEEALREWNEGASEGA